MHLLEGTLLQGGRYRIESMLGQGGFGITYRATQIMLGRTVAIKEFFFRSCCSRESNTNSVTIPTEANRELVGRFKRKFVKEAQIISSLSHKSVVQIYDVFEENDTAYYVMECIEGQSLSEIVEARIAIPQAEAIGYITAVGDALKYIHSKHINHLDVKPNNIMRCNDGRIVLLDFGVSKQYDAMTDKGTSTTPVGISHGYSPLEQYRRGGVQTFSPQSDVYALAATLYKLLTGDTPPEAVAVQDDGLPLEPLQIRGISPNVIQAIVAAMQPRRQRTQSVEEFISQLTTVPAVILPQANPDNTDSDVMMLVNPPQANIKEPTVQSQLQPRPQPQPQFVPQQQQQPQSVQQPQPQSRPVPKPELQPEQQVSQPLVEPLEPQEVDAKTSNRWVILVPVLLVILAAGAFAGYKLLQNNQEPVQQDTISVQQSMVDSTATADTMASQVSTPTQQKEAVKEQPKKEKKQSQPQQQPQTRSTAKPASPVNAREAAKKRETNRESDVQKAANKAQENRDKTKENKTQPKVTPGPTTQDGSGSSSHQQRRRED